MMNENDNLQGTEAESNTQKLPTTSNTTEVKQVISEPPTNTDTNKANKNTPESSTGLSTTEAESNIQKFPTTLDTAKVKQDTLESPDTNTAELIAQLINALKPQFDIIHNSIQNLEKQIEHKHSEQNNIINLLIKDMKDIKDRLESPKQKKIKSILSSQKEQEKKDENELRNYEREAQYWYKESQNLNQIFTSAFTEFKEKLVETKKNQQKLSPEIKERVKSRQEALYFIFKMFKRLQDSNFLTIENLESAHTLPSIKSGEFEDVFDNQSFDEKSFNEVINQKIKLLENERWQIVITSRNEAEKTKKRFLTFVETKILQLIDGVTEGKKYSKEFVENLKETTQINQEDSHNLDRWLEIHQNLEDILLKNLQSIKVYRMETDTKRGCPVDFKRHTPLDTEADNELENESIKEVTRHGYEYEQKNTEKFVLRPAQVIVVKNK